MKDFKPAYDKRLEELDASSYSVTEKEKLKAFLKKKQADRVSFRRLCKLAGQLRTLQELFNVNDLSTFTPQQVTDLLIKIDSNAEWKEWTRHDYRVVLSGYLEHIDGSNVRSKAIKITIPKRNKPQEKLALTQADIDVLKAHTPYGRIRTAFQFLFDSAARINELLDMNIEHYRFDENGRLCFDLQGTKNAYARQEIPIDCSPEAKEAFKQYIFEHPKAADPKAPLWLDMANNRLSERNFQKYIDLSKKRAGLQKRTNLHWFRHSKITQLRRKWNDTAVKLYARWSPDSEMLGTYGENDHFNTLAENVDKTNPSFNEEKKSLARHELVERIRSNPLAVDKLIEALELAGAIDLLSVFDSERNRTISKAPWAGDKLIVRKSRAQDSEEKKEGSQ